MKPTQSTRTHILAAILYTIAPAWHFRMTAIHLSTLDRSAVELLMKPVWLLALLPGVVAVVGSTLATWTRFRFTGWAISVLGVGVMVLWSLLGCCLALVHVRDVHPALTAAWLLSVAGGGLGLVAVARSRPSFTARRAEG